MFEVVESFDSLFFFLNCHETYILNIMKFAPSISAGAKEAHDSEPEESPSGKKQ